jgi:type VI secretion system protein ImpF
MARDKGFVPSVWDRLMAASDLNGVDSTSQAMTLAQLKAAVAHDLEGLLNTRLAIAPDALSQYPRCRRSILSYGLRDFAGMCLTSSDDQTIICECLKAAIECHEPRLSHVRAEVFCDRNATNRLDFVISGTLKGQGTSGWIEFNAMLQPSTLHYSISQSVRRANIIKAAA